MAAKNDLIVRLLLDNAQFIGGVRSSSKEMMQMRASIEKGTDILDSFTGGLIKGAMKFASWGAAAAAAGKVLTDTFMSAETSADNYHRMQTQVTDAYTFFVNTLEHGSWNNFFSNLNRAINGAAELYDKLDRLGSIKANNSAAIAIIRYRIAENSRLFKDKSISDEERRIIQAQLKSDEREIRRMMGEEVSAGKKAGFAQIKQSFLDYGLSEKQAREATYNIINRGQAYYDEMAQKLKEWISGKKSTNTQTISGNWGAITKDDYDGFEPAAIRLARAVVQGESSENRLQGLQKYSEAVAYATQSSREASEVLEKAYMQIGSTGGAKSVAAAKQEAEVGSLNYISETISRLKRERGNTLDTSKQAAIDAQISELVAQRIRINYGDRKAETIGASAAPTTFVGVDGAAEQLSEKIKKIKEAQEATNMLRKELTDDAMQSSVYGLIDAFSALGDVVGGTAGKFISFAAQSAASIAQLLSQNAQLLASAQAAALGGAAKSAFQLPFPFNLAMWASLSATVLGIFASLPKFADGGIVGGLSGGDRNLARVNAGEMILNNTQQRRLFAMLDGKAAPQGGAVTFRISGDALVGVIENYNRKTRATL